MANRVPRDDYSYPAAPDPHRDEKGRYAERPTPASLADQTTGEQIASEGHTGSGGGGGFGMPYERIPLWSLSSGGAFPPSVEGAPAFFFGNGGNFANPMGYAGYGSLYTGTHPVYRFMLANEYVQLVRAIATADVLCNKWEYVAVNAIGKKYVTFIRDMLDPLRWDLMNDFFMRGRDHGMAPGEMIWERKGFRWWLQRIKPLLVDVTECLRDQNGDFSGLINYRPNQITGQTAPNVRLAAPYKAFKYTYNAEAGYLYGRSWLENIRTFAFRSLLDCEQQAARLIGKITGIQTVITYPAGSFQQIQPDGTTKSISYGSYIQTIIERLATGAPGVGIPSLSLPITNVNKIETAKIIAELAQKSLINFELLNHGTNAPAIEGILNRKREAIEGIFAGGMRPAGVGMRNGDGKANTGEHKDTSSKVSQLEDQGFARAMQVVVDAILVLNGGEIARGSVRIMPPSITDNKREYVKAFFLAALNDPDIAMEMLRTMDVNAELANLDIRVSDSKFDVGRIEKKQEKQQKMQLQAKQAAAKQTAGNGNGKGSTKAPAGGRPTKGNGQPLKRPQPARRAAALLGGRMNGHSHN